MQEKGLSAQINVQSCTIFCAYGEQGKGQKSDVGDKQRLEFGEHAGQVLSFGSIRQ